MTRTCEHCRGDMPIMARSHAKTCSPRCRKALSRAKVRNPLPVELKTRDRWVRRDAKKVPLTSAGMAASSTDPRTWSTYKDAAASTAGVGLGFVLSDEDDIVCLDLDHCVNPLTGRVAPWAAAILRDAGATYVEVSPSGDGLHIWGRADVRQGRRIRRPDGTAVEIYGTGRYIAMTGRRHGSSPSILADLSAVVSKLTAR
ncbi:bifunctional DNA primase/polymerase [Streptomyces sp. SID5910]|uniref:bifunctional DNA primase/polymerase n=1 Tax=Streptomyces sp. SID5910 TaxID=2690312 RepID=UPI00136CCEE1|nr:bifunctional DNA primase/polymerase [Streptomyces sp. SID5910]MYR43051.1 DNA primase [Streptomyces sp. SID5910]